MTLDDDAVARVLHAWWREVTQDRSSGAARAARAILRRAHDVTAATLTEPYQQLFRRLRDAGWAQQDARANDVLAAIAGLLVHVEVDAGGAKLAAAMGRCPAGSDRPAVSELRLRRLLDADDLDTLFNGLRRALPLMGSGVPVYALAKDLLRWARPRQRDAVRKRWAYDYYDPGPANAEATRANDPPTMENP